MGLLDRPYAPTWKQNRSVYRHTPDAIVYVNGAVSLDACPTCKRQIELQKYITSVSVDSSTDPIATASISLVVPKHETDVFGSDGNWLLQPGLEIQVLFRGYFDESGLVKENGLGDVRMYPYYQVFRGVVKDVSHEFSGGSTRLRFRARTFCTSGRTYIYRPMERCSVLVRTTRACSWTLRATRSCASVHSRSFIRWCVRVSARRSASNTNYHRKPTSMT